jgi:hypothetical protein
MQLACVGVLRAPAVDLDFDLLGQLATKVIDVDAGASIDLRRIFACEKADAHKTLLTLFLAATVKYNWRPFKGLALA